MSEVNCKMCVAVIGAGPAGIRAAETLVQHGLRPILIDEAAKPGGQIYRQPPAGADRPGEEIYGLEAAKAARLHAVVAAHSQCIDYRPNTLAWNVVASDGGFMIDLLANGIAASMRVDRLILATGATDRALPFPGWLTPGVFTLGAAQIALKSQGVAIGRRVALVGAGPLLPLLVTQYLAAGIKPVVALDVTPFAAKIAALPGLTAQPRTLLKGLRYIAHAMLGGVRIQSGIRAIKALGDARVTGLAYTTADGRVHAVACDAVGASFGLRSESQVADLVGCRFEFDGLSRQWQPVRDAAGRATVEGVYLAGDGAAIAGADVAELAGERAALALMEDAGVANNGNRARVLDAALRRQPRFRRALETAYPFPAHLLVGLADDTVVCRCEGITAGRLRTTIRERAPGDINRLKAFTRLGMGRCQGRVCGHVAAELLAQAPAGAIATAGRLRAQPPIKPLPMSAATERTERA
jgi:NADPH-dependent 2,4-dienoyl-CoA reductase/sulfur reductase-like enzyme